MWEYYERVQRSEYAGLVSRFRSGISLSLLGLGLRFVCRSLDSPHAMANRTDPAAKSIRGTNPQNLVEKILRSKIYQNTYWKEQCFGLTAETLVDKAMELDHLGGTFGGNRKPTPFMCLVMKMLQIQPEKDIVVEFIKNEEYKYVVEFLLFCFVSFYYSVHGWKKWTRGKESKACVFRFRRKLREWVFGLIRSSGTLRRRTKAVGFFLLLSGI